MTKAELIEKKRKLKEKFDAEYDEKDGDGGTYYDDLKQEASKQAEVSWFGFSFIHLAWKLGRLVF